MFDQTFVTGTGNTTRPWTMAVSLGLQTLAAAALLILPLLHVAALQVPQKTSYWTQIHLPPRVQNEVARPAAARLVKIPYNVFTAPMRVPSRIDTTPDLPGTAPVLDDAPVSQFSLPAALPSVQLPVSAPVTSVAVAPPPVQPVTPVRVSGGAQAARLIFSPRPDYPALAKAARIEGVVRLEAVIGRDGAIRNLRLVSGPPLLVAAALAAVERWRYQPTLLNAEPVEVATEIEVRFTLSR